MEAIYRQTSNDCLLSPIDMAYITQDCRTMQTNNDIYQNSMSANSTSSGTSSGTSSVFSNEEENYEQKVREIEDYYVRTLLDDGEDETGGEKVWNRSEPSSVASSPRRSVFTYEPVHIGEKSMFGYGGKSLAPMEGLQDNNNNGSDNVNPPVRKELEVKINSEYAPKSDLLPLTVENLERLSLTSEKPVGKQAVHIKKTTNGGNIDNGNREDANRGLYKTELCESFTTKGACRYGNKCQFAHGLSELKFRQFGNNFRTKPCINWTKLGYCPYGKRCCFKHGSDQDIKVYLKAGTYLSNAGKEPKKNLHANVKALQKITW